MVDRATPEKKARGFTLIELMIAVAIVAILASIAIPAYQKSVQKSRRADAMSTLLQLQLAQEKWRANNTAYTTSLSSLKWNSSVSADGFYTVAITQASATTFTITATPKTGGPQVGDSCGTFTVTQNGPDLSANKACWNR